MRTFGKGVGLCYNPRRSVNATKGIVVMETQESRPKPWYNALYSFFMVLVVFGALYSTFFFFSTLRAVAARTFLPEVEGVASTQPVYVPPAKQESPQVAQRKEPINILMLGIDERQNGAGPWLSDTIILISIDPARKEAAMLSIPRDLWVTIPGYGQGRINMAHLIGDVRKYPGGGPALAKATVWNTLGVPVHYYVRANFAAFEQLIDAMGGLTIEVKTAIYDDQYPDENYGIMTIEIPAGVQHMDGKTALQYVRSRHGNSDYDRMARQQVLLLAARDKLLSGEVPLSRIPKLIEIAIGTLKTDLPVGEILALSDLAKNIGEYQIRQGIIDTSMTETFITPEGWMVEVADWEKVRQLVNSLFPSPTPGG
jgi:LCP family protein required for cell wall assembly